MLKKYTVLQVPRQIPHAHTLQNHGLPKQASQGQGPHSCNAYLCLLVNGSAYCTPTPPAHQTCVNDISSRVRNEISTPSKAPEAPARTPARWATGSAITKNNTCPTACCTFKHTSTCQANVKRPASCMPGNPLPKKARMSKLMDPPSS